jgi:membrane fusion protein, multidrug efflux system
VQPGPLLGALRVVEAGLEAGDRVVVSRLQRAVPGTRVEPEAVEIRAATTTLAGH